jgi:hypothetical protein
MQQAESRLVLDLLLSEGLRAYSMQQSYVQTLLAINLHSIWILPLEDIMEPNQENDEHNDGDNLDGDDNDDNDGNNNGNHRGSVAGGEKDSNNEL